LKYIKLITLRQKVQAQGDNVRKIDAQSVYWMPFALWALGNSRCTLTDVEKALDLPVFYFRELRKRRTDLYALVQRAKDRRSDPKTHRLLGDVDLGAIIPDDWIV
jgi:hypothetical protein